LGLLSGLWQRAIAPESGFRARAAEAPSLWEALRGMLLLRTPLAFASYALGYWTFSNAYQNLRGLEGKTGALVSQLLPESMNLEDVRSALAELPRLPEWSRVLPWLLVAAPFGILSLWLHDAVWDHGCLWMLGGLKARRGFRVTMIAEAEALSVGSIGVALGFLGSLPQVGGWLALPLAGLAFWFWILRGFALAAWQDCPVWKGIAATLLHAVLATCCLVALAGFFFAILASALG